MVRIDVFSVLFKKNLFYKSKLISKKITNLSSEIRKKRKKWSLPLPLSSNNRRATIFKKDQGNNWKKNNLLEEWRKQKISLKEKFPEGWNPLKKLSPDTMNQIKILRQQDPIYTVPVLSNMFKVSPEAIRRILKSKWKPSPEEYANKLARWKKREILNLRSENMKEAHIAENEHKEKIQKTDVSKQKNAPNKAGKRGKVQIDETTKGSSQVSSSSKNTCLSQRMALSMNTSLSDKLSKETDSISNQNSSSIPSLPFHRLMMSIQSIVGQESTSWNNNTESSNKNYTDHMANIKTGSRDSASSLINRQTNDMFRPNIDVNFSRPMNQPPLFNNILIHDNDPDQEKQNYNRYQHFHLFDQTSQLPPPLFQNNMMMLSTLPPLSQGHQPLNQNIDRGKQYSVNHTDEAYNSSSFKDMLSNKFNTTSPKIQKSFHYCTGSSGKSSFHLNDQSNIEFHENLHKQSLTPKSKSEDTNRSSNKASTTDDLPKILQETLPQKKNQKEGRKQFLRPTVPLPRPKLIVKNDAVMSFIEGIEEKDLGEHIYTPSNPVPCLDGKLNGILTIRIAKQYFYKSENDGIKRRALWGTDIYTDDSDIVAILLHTGRLKKKRPSCDAIVKVRVLPRLIKYSGSLRHNIMSRGWKTKHDGESIMIEDFKWVEDKTRKGRSDMKERIAARYRLQLSL
ncbi:hypothetical protein PMAC_001587 [Pneumocystis sp. 'macacae']|nr:hypothetical protein PMAC_001587 [Pneumocystis sp. 'macacae']